MVGKVSMLFQTVILIASLFLNSLDIEMQRQSLLRSHVQLPSFRRGLEAKETIVPHVVQLGGNSWIES